MPPPPKLSLIIPFHGDEAPFRQKTLPFLQENHKAFHEIIIVSTDETKPSIPQGTLKALRKLKSPKGRGLQMAIGAENATGEWLLFIHADTTLVGNWQQAVHAHIGAPAQNVGVFRLKFDTARKSARLLELWVRIRNTLFGLAYGDQGLLIAQALYKESGGFRRDYPIMEDVEMVRRLRRQRGVERLNAFALTSFEKYAKEGILKRGSKNLFYITWFFLGGSPERLYHHYYKSPPENASPHEE